MTFDFEYSKLIYKECLLEFFWEAFFFCCAATNSLIFSFVTFKKKARL